MLLIFHLWENWIVVSIDKVLSCSINVLHFNCFGSFFKSILFIPIHYEWYFVNGSQVNYLPSSTLECLCKLLSRGWRNTFRNVWRMSEWACACTSGYISLLLYGRHFVFFNINGCKCKNILVVVPKPTFCRSYFNLTLNCVEYIVYGRLTI